jgi:glycerol uptake facilitator-like aquaporin
VVKIGEYRLRPVNPAVTIGLATAGVFPSRRVTPYIVAQLAGAIAAAWVLLVAYGGPVANLGATLVDTQRVTFGGAFMNCRREPATGNPAHDVGAPHQP